MMVVYGERTSPEPTFTPSTAAWQVHERAVRDPGEPLDSSTATLATSKFDFDFGRVRVHRDDNADQAAVAMSARAYTWGEHLFFRQGEYEPRSDLLMHELGHVVEQAWHAPTVRRAPNAPAASPATYIIVYGTGRVNPEEPTSHNVGGLFKMAAEAKGREIRARLGAQAAANNIVLEYTPTEVELKAVLNKKYALPVKEVHIFSHGWDEGVNLGGRDPGPGKKAAESTEDVKERRLIAEDLGNYAITWAAEPNVVLYGCNTGNPAGSPAFAQTVSDAFGVPVKAPATSSHFQFGGAWGVQQVPDTPGAMKDFAPSTLTLNLHMNEVERIANLIVLKMKTKGGLLSIIKATQDAQALRGQLAPHVTWLNQVLGDTRSSIPDRAALLAKVADFVRRADAALAGP